ncbi:MAG: hypothetical protein UV20_C0009G0030 [Candidatus Magasanikbacteria bacterium GW2011_GWA2_42_32]|uniref:Uncharacterized protein n=1 Tax=Candidatus Magasanikbacteria bacterium GW2011_GWA2_42_32 TaxID=1619039 RepID=A0A0G1CCY5_9BACT|nr:MAG: hypothetical protein UV20_C0009G0030 [Candidatus Magasanikbacteria bacterium GW2011_GWA2_42_32]HBX15895.1 hypothetical protein [Candidatus Magasanikbacteria bacterium]
MPGKILNKKLVASAVAQTHTLGSMIRGISIFNYGPSDVLLDFDHIIDGDSRLVPAGESLNIGADFLTLYYQYVAGGTAATLYVTFIQNP